MSQESSRQVRTANSGAPQNVPRTEDKRSAPCNIGDDNQAQKVGGGSPVRASVRFVGVSGEQYTLLRKYSQSCLYEVFSRVRVREVKRKLEPASLACLIFLQLA